HGLQGRYAERQGQPDRRGRHRRPRGHRQEGLTAPRRAFVDTIRRAGALPALPPVAQDDDTKHTRPARSASLEQTEVLARVRLLSGKYKLGRLLGEGGMGSVYEGEHTGLDAKVAIKLLSEGGALDHKALTRFRREARAMGAIRHENVVTVLDTGADDAGVPYLVMELLEGESLAAVLRRERVLSPALSIWIGAQVLSGLAAAHAKSVIHRDLKPGNVFIARQADGSHKVKILDFGISKVSEATDSLNVTADGALV